PTVDQNDPCNLRENFRNIGPHARVAHIAWPNTHMLAWSTRLTWPSLCSPHSHTHITTWSCLASDHAFVDHTVVTSHMTNRTGDHMPMWRRQNSFLAFVKVRLFAFWVHTWYGFDVTTILSLMKPKNRVPNTNLAD
ncbi:hypothetical protein J1N35_018205, partial [Gossypium stocksii]